MGYYANPHIILLIHGHRQCMQVQPFTASCAHVTAALTLSCSQKMPVSVFLCCSSLFTLRLINKVKVQNRVDSCSLSKIKHELTLQSRSGSKPSSKEMYSTGLDRALSETPSTHSKEKGIKVGTSSRRRV